ncbi:hypothetical protein NC652_017033 [Populus alba x Populus x berolinensis]|nr:hypothetical protein NC652_017033 [Populus alba x Populus x berolinensis]
MCVFCCYISAQRLINLRNSDQFPHHRRNQNSRFYKKKISRYFVLKRCRWMRCLHYEIDQCFHLIRRV